jgi:hypothetical protein
VVRRPAHDLSEIIAAADGDDAMGAEIQRLEQPQKVL